MKDARVLMRLIISTLVFVVLILLTSCHPEPVMPQDARILIIDPAAESVMTTDTITIKTFVDRFHLVDKAGQLNTSGEGHIVYYMDVSPSTEQSKSALSAEGTCAVSTQTSYTWDNVQPGEHVFWVQLVNNDNTPLQPPEAVRVYVTVSD